MRMRRLWQSVTTLAVVTVLTAAALVPCLYTHNKQVNAAHPQTALPGWQGTAGSPEEYFFEIAEGHIGGHSYFHKFGKGLVGTTMVPIASSLKYPTPTAATTLEVVSNDADDTAAGDGARTVTIQGVDANWDEITQTVAMNGLTPVVFPIDMLRVYRWWVETSGVYATSALGSHQGTITIQTSPGAVLWFNGTVDPYPKGQSEIAGYTVPDGFTAYVFLHNISVDSTKAVDIIFIRRKGADTITAPFTPMRAITEYVAVSGSLTPETGLIPINGAFPARTDLIWLAKVASGTASISVLYDILLIADGW